ncbi:MAG TPA: hypothetical protein VGK00_12435 [Anaerolineales bacterium]|jgi:hypothetical protein
MADITRIIDQIPYRLALAGGWIDQPFVSRHNPSPPGSMVVVGIRPEFRFMDRCGLGTSTRQVAARLWNGKLPQRDPAQLVRELYASENEGRAEPSGSQDMAGLIYPGINRLDYDYHQSGGIFPAHIESTTDPSTAAWLENVVHILPVAPRPAGYNPFGDENLDHDWVRRLGLSGQACYAAICGQDIQALGESLNECMRCWEVILPRTVHHPALTLDLAELLGFYQEHYAGAMFSGCGGGYLFVISDEPVPGSFKARVRLE